MSHGDHVHQLLHQRRVDQCKSSVKRQPLPLHQISQTRRRLPPVCRGAHVGGLPVLCVCGAAEDSDCHVNYNLQQDLGESEQHVEICQTLSHHSGSAAVITLLFFQMKSMDLMIYFSSLMRILFCRRPSHFSLY